MKETINSRAIEIYDDVRKDFDLLERKIKRLRIKLKNLSETKKERQEFLRNLKKERDKAIRLRDKKNG